MTTGDDLESIDQTIARRTMASYGLEGGDRVVVELLAGDVREGRLRPRAVTGTAIHATSTVLIVAGYDDAGTSYRIPWAAVAVISTSDAAPPQHPAI